MDRDQLEEFFVAYGRDLATARDDVIAAHFDEQVLFLSDDGAEVKANDDDFRRHVAAAADSYQGHGINEADPAVTRFDTAGARVGVAWVTWTYLRPSGDPLFEADYVYDVRDNGTRLVIAVVVSINERERLEEYLERAAVRPPEP
jgi:hypothetical protein